MSLCENIDTTSATGRCFLSMMGAIHQMERELRAERAAAGRSSAKARGKTGGSLKLTPKNWKMPESSTKTQIKPPPRFVRLPALGEGNSSLMWQKNGMVLVERKIEFELGRNRTKNRVSA